MMRGMMNQNQGSQEVVGVVCVGVCSSGELSPALRHHHGCGCRGVSRHATRGCQAVAEGEPDRVFPACLPRRGRWLPPPPEPALAEKPKRRVAASCLESGHAPHNQLAGGLVTGMSVTMATRMEQQHSPDRGDLMGRDAPLPWSILTTLSRADSSWP